MASSHHVLIAAATLNRRLLKRRLLQLSSSSRPFSTVSITENQWSSQPPPPSSASGKTSTGDADSSQSSKAPSSSPSTSAPTASTTNKVPSPQKKSRSSSVKHDWREWFRSSDYDDPWSPYMPLQKTDYALNKNSLKTRFSNSNDNILRKVLDGSWKRRRHGMNLEPLNVQIVGLEQNNKNESSVLKHKNYGVPKEGETSVNNNINDVTNTIKNNANGNLVKAQGQIQWLDGQTRFLCRMLDDLYRTGIRREMDRPRKERCHRMIGKLLTVTPKTTSDKKINRSNSDVKFSGLAQRANAILERMELCSPVALELKRSQYSKSKKGQEQNSINDADEPDIGELIASLIQPVGSYQGRHEQYPLHLERTKHVLPTPTRDIYTMVLLSFAKESGPIHVAQQAEDVIWSMIQRANQRSKIISPDMNENEESTIEHLNPSTEHWNCALQCWANSTDPDRGFHAYSFLMSWLEWNKLCKSGESSLGGCLPNIASYHAVLQACLWNNVPSGNEEDNARAREMGSGVAIRVWKGMEKVDHFVLNITSYTLLLRAICQTSELPTATSSSRQALTSLARVFQRCCEGGMVTNEIMQLVMDATTESQFEQLVGKYVKDDADNSKEENPTIVEIMKRIPSKWTKNVN